MHVCLYGTATGKSRRTYIRTYRFFRDFIQPSIPKSVWKSIGTIHSRGAVLQFFKKHLNPEGYSATFYNHFCIHCREKVFRASCKNPCIPKGFQNHRSRGGGLDSTGILGSWDPAPPSVPSSSLANSDPVSLRDRDLVSLGLRDLCLWATETLCLWGTETLCLCGTGTLCLCATHNLAGGAASPPRLSWVPAGGEWFFLSSIFFCSSVLFPTIFFPKLRFFLLFRVFLAHFSYCWFSYYYYYYYY